MRRIKDLWKRRSARIETGQEAEKSRTESTPNSTADGHSNSKLTLSSDRPIASKDEDKFGRSVFAAQIGDAVGRWGGNDSLVVALYGPWGSGKTSIKNMVAEHLRTEHPSVRVVEFNPWEIRGTEKVRKAFFDEIGIAIEKGALGSRSDKKRIIRAWRRYSRRFESGERLAGLLKKLLGLLIFVGLLLPTGRHGWVVRSVLAASFAVYLARPALEWLAKACAAIQDFLEAGIEETSGAEVKSEARVELQKLSAPILVIIDDLDRLTPREVEKTLQLVKGNGDLPNLVYLLLCDRQIMEKRIGIALKDKRGDEYLEKIVQVAFDVPMIDPVQLRSVLFKGIDKVIMADGVLRTFDETRWGNVFLGGLAAYFATPRDVNRFLSTLSFHVSAFRSEGSFEVNIIDLIALEALRLFEPELYRSLSTNKKLLTSVSDNGFGKSEADKAEILKIADSVAPERQAGTRALIQELFPPVAWALGGSHFGPDFTEEWYRKLRVCSANVFDRYFQLAVPKGDVSQAIIDRILASTGDRASLRQRLEALGKDGLLGAVLARLDAYKEQVPIENAVPFATALCDIGDNLTDQRWPTSAFSPLAHARRIIYWNLRQERDLARRGAILCSVIEKTDGLVLPVSITSLITPSKEGGLEESFVSNECIEKLKALCLTKIREAAKGRIDQKHLLNILYRWKEWAGEEEPQRYCESLIQTREGLLDFLRTASIPVRSSGLGDYVARVNWRIHQADVEAFVPFEVIESKINALPTDGSYTPEETRSIEAFKKCAERRRAGVSDNYPFDIASKAEAED